jgi:hypothetical protein
MTLSPFDSGQKQSLSISSQEFTHALCRIMHSGKEIIFNTGKTLGQSTRKIKQNLTCHDQKG